MVNLRFMGGTHEVGRNAVLVGSGQKNLLLDYGVHIGDKPHFPAHVRPKDVDGIVISHAHLDHSGGVPMFYLSTPKPVFGTPLTMQISQILLKDMIKLSGYYLPFEYIELNMLMKNKNDLPYGKPVKMGNMEFSLLNAGHIQGSAMVDIKTGGKRILYTGDFNTENTRLVHAAKAPRYKLDAVIIESTYANTDHEVRRKIEDEFVGAIKQVLHDDGKVFIPAFAVGRSQEMLCVMNAHKLNYNTVVDGMARAVNLITQDYPDYVRTPKTFMKVMNKTRAIQGWRDRRTATKKADIIVAPSGMLQGGTAMHYMEKLALDSRNAIFLVSFQVPGTGGAKLLESGMFPIKDVEQEVQAQVRHFDFSSHCGKTRLEAFLRSLKGKPKVYVIHGESENCEALAQWARDELDLDAAAPKENDEFTV
jgi:putative mRNA 3-end processing factor